MNPAVTQPAQRREQGRGAGCWLLLTPLGSSVVCTLTVKLAAVLVCVALSLVTKGCFTGYLKESSTGI